MDAFENEHVQVLMAEDDENLGLILSERLKSKGFEVDLAPDDAG
jgi:DNA-binding response OmpR family regulator